MRSPALRLLFAAALAATPLHAAITDITLAGRGSVATSTPGDIYGTPVFGPAVGTPVTISLVIRLGGNDPDTGQPTPPPDGFTGRFTFREELLVSDDQSFAWTVAGGLSGARSGRGNAYQGGFLNFVAGRLTGFSLFTDSDPEVNVLTHDSWGYLAGEGGWGGAWAPVPEPASWAMLVAGFAATGATLRYRRRVPI